MVANRSATAQAGKAEVSYQKVVSAVCRLPPGGDLSRAVGKGDCVGCHGTRPPVLSMGSIRNVEGFWPRINRLERPTARGKLPSSWDEAPYPRCGSRLRWNRGAHRQS